MLFRSGTETVAQPAAIVVNGTIKYFNTANTPLNNVSIKLVSGANEITTLPTDASGSYSFANVCPGTYNVVITTLKDMGGINSTDALGVNIWGSTPSSIERVKFLAGDVTDVDIDGKLRVNAFDAQKIQEYFLTSGASPQVMKNKPWEFWNAGVLINSQPQTNDVMQITVEAGSRSE